MNSSAFRVGISPFKLGKVAFETEQKSMQNLVTPERLIKINKSISFHLLLFQLNKNVSSAVVQLKAGK